MSIRSTGPILLLLLTLSARGGVVEWLEELPFVVPADPVIQTQPLTGFREVDLDGRRIAVFPFTTRQGGEPRPPDFAEPLADVLGLYDLGPQTIRVESLPWAGLPDRRLRELSESERQALLDQAALRLGADLAVVGETSRLYRTASGGLTADVVVLLKDLSTGEVLYRSRKRARWTRRFPLQSCLLALAEDFVIDWLPASTNGKSDPK